MSDQPQADYKEIEISIPISKLIRIDELLQGAQHPQFDFDFEENFEQITNRAIDKSMLAVKNAHTIINEILIRKNKLGCNSPRP